MISFVVLVHGFEKFVADCLSSLCRMADRSDVEVILVDNGSPKEDVQSLRQALADGDITVDRFVELPENVGFAAGMNAGISKAHGDVVVALNSDVLVGAGVARAITKAWKRHPEAGFYAVPLYSATVQDGRLVPLGTVQGEAVGLTWYGSCMPVRGGMLAPRFILGPPGPAVAMSRRLIDALIGKYGSVYDPHFFLYGEDVDLYLRAAELGWTTVLIPGEPGTGDVIWHAGSASTAEGMIPSIRKSPEMARRILDGCWDNIIGHAGVLELPLLGLAQGVFRCSFYAKYWRANSLRSTMRLMAGTKTAPRPRALARRTLRFRPGILRRMALVHTSPFPWARAKTTG